MAYTSQSETIAGGVALALSWTMLLLRIAQQTVSYVHHRKFFPGATTKPPSISEWIGTAFFFASASLLASLFSLRLWNLIQTAKAGADVSDAFQSKTLRYSDIIAILAATAIWTLKGSYMCIFWGMSSVMRRGMRIALICVSVYMVLSYFVVLGVDLAWCRPLSSMWKFNGTWNSCNTMAFWDVIPFNIKFAMTITTDLAILVFTLLLLRPSEARQRGIDRRAVGFIVFIGCLSIISSIARYTYNRLLVTHQSAPGSVKIQYNNGFTVWQCLEILFATLAYGLTSARQQIKLILSHAVPTKVLLRVGSTGWRRAHSPRIESADYTSEKTGPSSGPSSPGLFNPRIVEGLDGHVAAVVPVAVGDSAWWDHLDRNTSMTSV